MKRIPLKSFVSHTTIFVAGKNFKSESLITESAESQFMYEMESDKLFMLHKGHLRVLNGATVAYWEPKEYKDIEYLLGIEDLKAPEKPAPIAVGNPGPIKAQVETPHQVVQNPPTRRSVK